MKFSKDLLKWKLTKSKNSFLKIISTKVRSFDLYLFLEKKTIVFELDGVLVNILSQEEAM